MADASTRLVGVVGHPIGHSISPPVWTAAFEHEGRNAVFLAFDVAPERFADFVKGMQAAGARGFNVTLPHKRAAFEICTERSVEAEQTGAVNVLVLDDDRIIGTNTDVCGIRGSLEDLGTDVDGVRVLVVGAGGAAAAVVWELCNQGAKVTIVNRTRERAESLAQRFSGVAVADYGDLGRAVTDAEVLIHSTAVGMDGASSVIGDDLLAVAAKGRLRAVLDVVYAPKETALVHAARGAGLRAADGLRMLVHQAAEAYRAFWDVQAPVEVMWSAAQRAAGR